VDILPGGHDQGRGIVTGGIDFPTVDNLLVRLTDLTGFPRCDIGSDLSGVTFVD
jgi:hypothetical protein